MQRQPVNDSDRRLYVSGVRRAFVQVIPKGLEEKKSWQGPSLKKINRLLLVLSPWRGIGSAASFSDDEDATQLTGTMSTARGKKGSPQQFTSSCLVQSEIQEKPMALRSVKLNDVEFFEGWKPLSPLQLAVEEVMALKALGHFGYTTILAFPNNRVADALKDSSDYVCSWDGSNNGNGLVNSSRSSSSSRRRSNSIHGIMNEGIWTTDPIQVKDTFLNFFKEKFEFHDSNCDFPSAPSVSTLNDTDHLLLEKEVTMEEIKFAVWNCGNDKAPGPDGFTFGFIKRYWEIFSHDIMEFVIKFFDSKKMPLGSNSSFITLIPKVSNLIHVKDYRLISLINIHYKIIAKILANRLAKVVDKIISQDQSAFISGRQILDGPLMLSEMIDWYKKRKKKMLIFKVDFEKAFDSVSWNYLDFMLHKLGFGLTWRAWIKACLDSSRTSILVNGSPTSEFSVKRDLRQGDPLSPLLFITIMEGLHTSLREACNFGMIHGINIGSSNITLSHMFYADDIIITTEWNALDMDNIIRILQVFYLASGLKINIHKSNVYGVGVFDNEVLVMANNTRCSPGVFLFNYLGLPIGANMNLSVNWKTLLDKFDSRLSQWKAKLLSIGGRLTLVKSVLGSLGIYYLSIFKVSDIVLKTLEKKRANFFWGGSHDTRKLAWVKWPIVLASQNKGGLDVGSLKSFNLALLLKWCWRMISNPNALWVKVIKGPFGIWSKIVGSSNFLQSNEIIPNDSIRYRVGCGSSIRFWKDLWIGNSPLYIRYNRLFRLDNEKDCFISDRFIDNQWSWNWSRAFLGTRNSAYLIDMINDITPLNLNSDRDVCYWSLSNDDIFSVRDARLIIDAHLLPAIDNHTV
ncbi:putative RNA-directed DNA polymerase, eukaryota, reverse transcriptase zinc-binding domain protein, partial [Tanacetum coccineum]